jgi:hypothetical protein
LPTWSGTPFNERNIGARLNSSDLFCQIGDPRKLEAIVVIDQANRDLVHEGQTTRIKLDTIPGTTLEGQIQDITTSNLEQSPASLSNQAGGGLATRTDKSGVQRPLKATYVARVPLDDANEVMQPGMRGRAKIRVGDVSLVGRLVRYLSRVFYFDI